MINFFRKIRKQLANENKFQRYMRYALGEMLLIMLGIFMALQLQNWNEKRKQETQFKTTLEQLYTSITYESQYFIYDTTYFKIQAKWIDQLLYNPDSFPDVELPINLNYITFWNGMIFSSEAAYYTQNLNYDPNNEEQVGLAKEILTYINTITSNKYNVVESLEKAVSEIDISVPIFYVDTYNDPTYPTDSLHYDSTDIQNLRTWLHSNKIRSILKKVKTYKDWNYQVALNLYKDGQSIKNLIKTYYPDVKLLYNNVGIIGSAINGWDKSTPMTLTNNKENIWEINLYLNAGEVKFRCRDSWVQNWGNNNQAFPTGIGVQGGNNIIVTEAGNYHIIFKPETGEYEFIKQDD